MKLTYDKEADAAYIYIKDKITAGEATKTISLDENIKIDFDRHKKLLGIEILSASKMLPKILLEKQATVSS